jgi:transposase InsO family protein
VNTLLTWMHLSSHCWQIRQMSGQKELLLWHWRLGISMSRIQELMVLHQAKDGNRLQDIMSCVITPAFKTAATCPIPCCAACELACACCRSTSATKQLAVEEKAGILSANQYQVGDLVSMDQFVSGTPGWLFSGYGREAQHNWFHGRTIFNDAASGAIWVEHQVSLGADETICAKEQFEEWLYELSCVEVAQHHSDNGVFTATEFREDCKLKHQIQTFSGVGAKHQNGRAEWSIQTIMSMACTFMIHDVSLHWDEQSSDAVALWPFAVCYAVWLYNRLPNGVTGLSPMEILTGTRSDHWDLLRTHMWGCPVYVLVHKLQDGKKFPKWNCRAQQGQFLGFSDKHSLLVATVCHLTTGFVSPQFHVVFDDHFHTVYGDGEGNLITDAICNLLWENDRERYSEDKYGSDGSLIYTPPPLDKVWLDEEGLCKCH